MRRRSLTGIGVILGLAAAFLMTRPHVRETAARADERIPAFVTATFPLATEVLIAGRPRHSEPRTVTLQGSGTILFERFVLTVAHVTAWDNFREGLRASGTEPARYRSARRLEEATYLMLPEGRVRLRPLARSDEADVALFWLPEEINAPDLPCSIGDSDALRLGESLLLVERDPSAGPLVRPAAVAALRGTSQTAAVASAERSFVLDIGLVSGESGSPLLIWRDRTCDLIGLAQGTYRGPRQLSWGIRIREALEALARSVDHPRAVEFLQAVCAAAVRPHAFDFCGS